MASRVSKRLMTSRECSGPPPSRLICCLKRHTHGAAGLDRWTRCSIPKRRYSLGSASIAQVHRALLTPRGWWGRPREVAVKVQRPGTEARMLGDLSNLRTFFSVDVVRRGLAWDGMLIIDQVEEETRQEFDFVGEARIMDSAHDAATRRGWRRFVPRLPSVRAQASVSVPKSVPGLVTKTVLVMDLLEGRQLSRLAETRKGTGRAERAAGRQMLSALGKTYGRLLFDDDAGLLHADPHPGNLLVQRRGLRSLRVGLVDWGQSRTYDLPMRLRIAALIEALCAAGDANGRRKSARILEAYTQLGVVWSSSASVEKQREMIAAAATDLFDTKPIPAPYVSDPTSEHYHSVGLQLESFPPSLIYFFRATQILRAMTEQMGCEWSLAEEWRPYARRLLRRKGRNPTNWQLAA